MEKDAKIENLRVFLTSFDERNKSIVDILLFCQQVVDQWKILGLPKTKAYFWFLATDSDSDRFPIGKQRKFWNKVSLKKMDLEAEKVFSNVPLEISMKTKFLLADLESSIT